MTPTTEEPTVTVVHYENNYEGVQCDYAIHPDCWEFFIPGKGKSIKVSRTPEEEYPSTVLMLSLCYPIAREKGEFKANEHEAVKFSYGVSWEDFKAQYASYKSTDQEIGCAPTKNL